MALLSKSLPPSGAARFNSPTFTEAPVMHVVANLIMDALWRRREHASVQGRKAVCYALPYSHSVAESSNADQSKEGNYSCCAIPKF